MTMLCDGMLLGAGGANLGPTITFIGSNATSTSSGTTSALTASFGATGRLSGDLLTVIVSGISGLVSASTPAGWTLAGSSLASGSVRYAIFYKISDGTETSVTFTSSGVTRALAALVHRGATAVGTIGTINIGGSTATATASGITPANPGTLLAFFYGNGNGNTIVTPPSGMNQRTLNATVLNTAVFDLPSTPATATGSKSLVWSSSNGVVAGLLFMLT